ncbi:MAG: hypothetical protein Q8O36_06265, partial [Candidatus Omnitrophota bacterium]|nr:hypothetical protein [Candidatus Omnitrophota bacterium]
IGTTMIIGGMYISSRGYPLIGGLLVLGGFATDIKSTLEFADWAYRYGSIDLPPKLVPHLMRVFDAIWPLAPEADTPKNYAA